MSVHSANAGQAWLSKVEQIASDVCRGLGCVLYDIEFMGTGAGRTLRIYVDKDGGPGIEDCSNVSKGLNAVLETDENLVPGGPYNLEVSTPGVDRLLKKPWHFEKVIGKKIRIRSATALETFGVTDPKWKNVKQVEEVLSAADPSGVTFAVKECSFRVPYESIEKAKVVFEVPGKGHPPKGAKKTKK